ncbi:MAG TPA: Tm-1-like ATP-binding domain-containing protein [Gemmataceae bacterium]|nr:Tm-1-like ATP-binding domain-containing protein [Gemmataceae bacterium]
MPAKTIAVLGTMDTKGREMDFLRAEIEKHGQRALLIDSGVVGQPQGKADISREQVAQAGGATLAALLKNPNRETAAPIMSRGASKIVLELVAQDTVHGIVSLGGTQGTTLSTAVMRQLPYGFPKVMVSTIASGNVAPFVDIKDITMMFPVTDILGLNPVSRKMLSNAAGAVCGMAESDVTLDTKGHPLVGITTVGITTTGAMKAIEVLETAGYETIVFHAVGTGGRAMEALMKEGVIRAVLDIATIEVSNQMYRALLAGGPERLTVAANLGLPQVICPGAIAILVYGTPDTIPPQYKDRKYVAHSPQISDIRLTADEQVAVGKEIARRLRGNRGPCTFMIPRRGFDSYSAEGQTFWDGAADAAFIDTLKAELPGSVRVVERDTDINNPAFATEIANTLIEQMREAAVRTGG